MKELLEYRRLSRDITLKYHNILNDVTPYSQYVHTKIIPFNRDLVSSLNIKYLDIFVLLEKLFKFLLLYYFVYVRNIKHGNSVVLC